MGAGWRTLQTGSLCSSCALNWYILSACLAGIALQSRRCTSTMNPSGTRECFRACGRGSTACSVRMCCGSARAEPAPTARIPPEKAGTLTLHIAV